jgi:zinc metalloprotease ZmpB
MATQTAARLAPPETHKTTSGGRDAFGGPASEEGAGVAYWTVPRSGVWTEGAAALAQGAAAARAAGADGRRAAAGRSPDVDLYFDDGRDGEYEYSSGTPTTKDVWNRHQPDGTTDEPALPGQVNYLYFHVRNRGTQDATNVVVHAYQVTPGAALGTLTWPQDWQSLGRAGLVHNQVVPAGGHELAGPIRWTPHGGGADALLVRVSADGDPSNLDPGPAALPCAAGPMAVEKLVRWDNNLGLWFPPVGPS